MSLKVRELLEFLNTVNLDAEVVVQERAKHLPDGRRVLEIKKLSESQDKSLVRLEA